ncbi:MAG: SDR family oxidoreductase [Spongiibacteraceae bacterium]|jgi:NAD(P)-dependent dehydrogenase (short-subunit alcohol dehydrogenase family)|nr:SDR family oxidoreductase [Spongiibacteraceae bacterium]
MRGWIVNISTASAELPEGPPFSHHDRNNHPMLYGASKAALNRMTVGLAAELEGSGVVANTLAPLGAVATPGAVALRMLPPQRDMIEGVEDMAEAALFLSLCDTGFTGNICYSLPLLNQQGIATRSLDGSKLYDGFIKGVDD